MRSLFGFNKAEDVDSAKASEKSSLADGASSELPPIFHCTSIDGPLQTIKPLEGNEKKVLEQLKKEIPNLIKDLPEVDAESKKYIDEAVPLNIEQWLTDECIARYVRARKGVYEDTRRALRKTIEWRAQTRPDALRPDVVEIENKTGKMYFNGFDKFSRPVIYMYNHRQNTKEPDNQIRWVIYTLEMVIRNMPKGVEKVSLAIDASHWGFSNSVSIGTAKKFLDVLANHYPERLGRAVIFRPPKFFTAFYSLVSPFIDPVTKAKVAFVNPDSADTKPQADSHSAWAAIEDCFVRDKLEVDCYGDWPFRYSHGVYWKAIEAEFAEHKAAMQAQSKE
ncbi:hypothetical protein EC988_002951 [Linderina pennispora]|nr:hypothetical protein EC988_002951 [Linderina pennispora]